MKTVIRTSALFLIVAGVFSANTARTQTSAVAVQAMNSSMPVPVCPPDDPNACGMGDVLGK